MKLRHLFLAASVTFLAFAAVPSVHAAYQQPNKVIKFNAETGLDATEQEMQLAWQQLQQLGTTKYVGGNIGSFRLDEASLIACALTLGSVECDNFLSTGKLTAASNDLGTILSKAMAGAAGMDLSYLTGSYTTGSVSGSSNSLPFASSVATATSAANAAGQCDPSVASKQVAVGIQSVNNIVTASMSSQYGFSQNSALGGSTESTGFATRSCLDKLFQGLNVNALFTPPSLTNLMSTLQNWGCSQAVDVATQVSGQFGNMSFFNTSNQGGFYPTGVFDDANSSGLAYQPGVGHDLTQLFGDNFVSTASSSSELTSLDSVLN